MSLIQLHRITKEYFSGQEMVLAVNDVSLKIDLGDFVTVMGPSGSGKSTLLYLLGGLSHPKQGRVLIDEIDIYSLSIEQLADFRKEYIGFIFQSFHLVPYLNVLENVLIPLTIGDSSKIEKFENASRILEKVNLYQKKKRLPNQLSGGEQQRVAIARALVNYPPIILADEPTGNLDSYTSKEIMELFQRLNEEGQTIIMVTHDRNNQNFAQHFITLTDGKIQGKIRGLNQLPQPAIKSPMRT
jgi:putative ABC transport system ATP-binding protein